MKKSLLTFFLATASLHCFAQPFPKKQSTIKPPPSNARIAAVQDASADCRTDSTIEYISLDGSNYLPQQKYITKYDANNRPIFNSIMSWDNTNMVWYYPNNTQAAIHSYTTNTATYISKKWSTANNDWVNIYQDNTTFDANRHIIAEQSQLWDATNNVWKDDVKYAYLYDANGNLLSQTDKTWNGSAWINNVRYTHTYDVNNNELTYLIENWNGTAWENSQREINTYNTNNDQLTNTGQNWDGATWVNNTRSVWTYDVNNNFTSYEYDGGWNATNNSWIGDFNYSYTYDVNNNPATYISQNWISGGWQNANKNIFTYDANNLKTEETDYLWNTSNNTWDTPIKYEYTYNANNLELSYTSTDWDGSNWINDEHMVRTYGSNNELLSIEYTKWNASSSTWVKEQENTFVHTCLTTAIQDAIHTSSLEIFPNPTNGQFSLSGLPESGSLVIYNYSGKVVYQTNLNATDLKVDLTGQSKGMYFYKINNGAEKTIQGKIVVE
jgi:hypothetical protein